MNATSATLPSVIGTLKRPKFSAGLLLQDDDLTQIIDYVRNMTQLLFRTMLGCGVMCGFKVINPNIECDIKLKFVITKGIALDCRGDLIELPNDQPVEINLPNHIPDGWEVWVVIGRGKEKPCAPRDTILPDGDASCFYTRICDTYEIQVLESKPVGSCPKGENNAVSQKTEDFIASPDDSGYEKHYEGACDCECICDCVVLAKVSVSYKKDAEGRIETPKTLVPKADYSVSRFARPVLMKDPRGREKSSNVEAGPVPPASPVVNAPTPPAPTPRAPRNR